MNNKSFDLDTLYLRIKEYCFSNCEYMINSEKYHQCSISDKNTCQIWDFLRYCYKLDDKENKNGSRS